jgi:LacI family transcriptional regulator
MGYKLDHFTVGTTEKEQKALNRVLKARGIQGLVIVGFNQKISGWALEWDTFAAVAYSGSLHEHFIHNVLSHSYQDTHDAIIRLHEMGYVRPGYVTEQYHVDAWRAGYNAALNTLGFKDKVPVLRMENRLQTAAGRKQFQKWFCKYKPDVLISSYREEFINLLRQEGVRIPEDVGYFTLDVCPAADNLSGLKQFREGALQTAVDLLQSMLLRHQFGPPQRPMCIQIPSEWNENGATLKTRV